MMSSKFETIKKNKIYIASFILPIVVMCFAYLSNGIFTQYSIIINDLESQYIKFFTYYRNYLFENGLIYSFCKGFGGNFFGVFSYYLASPLNLIAFLFPVEKIELVVSIIILLRFGLSSVSFTWFLKKIEKNANNLLTLSFALMYSLASYMVVISYHILWADAFVMLPIVVGYALDTFKGENIHKFIIAFALMAISNYYMAYMIGIFCICLFIHNCISYGDFAKWKQSFFNILKGALIAIGLSCWILLPSLHSLLQGKYELDAYLRENVGIRAFNIFAIIPKMFTGGYDSLGNSSAPFIYCGAGVMFMFIASLFLKNRTKREKIADVTMISFLFISLIYMPINKMWHAFSVTNSFPYRFTYIVVFFALWVAFIACNNFKDIDIKKFLPVALLVLIVYTGFGVWYPVHIRNRKILFDILIAITLFACMYFANKKKINVLHIVFLVVVLMDMTLNSKIVVGKNYQALDPQPIDKYINDYIMLNENYSKLDANGFIRVNSGRFDNKSYMAGFNGGNKPFDSILEYDSENVYFDTLISNDPTICDVVFGVDYRCVDNEFIKTDIKAFPIMYTSDVLTNDNSNGHANLASYIELITGEKVVDDNGAVDNNALIKASDFVNENGVEEIIRNKNKINVKVTAQTENETLATSIIWDDSWTVKINGEKVEKHRLLDNFIAVKLPKGECNIAFSYMSNGLILGVIISIITLICWVGYMIVKKKKQ